MKGKNILYINQATMVEAIQLWVNATFTNPPLVESVKKDANYNVGEGFIVDLGEQKEQP